MIITIGGKTYTSEEWSKWVDERLGPSGPAIELDQSAILALERVSTGADIHDTNALISHYKSCAMAGRVKGTERAKREMYERAIRLGRQK